MIIKKRIHLVHWFLLMIVIVSFGSKTSLASGPTIGKPIFTNITQTSADATWTSTVAVDSHIYCTNNNNIGNDNHYEDSNNIFSTHFVHLNDLHPGSSYSCRAHMTYSGVNYGSPIANFSTEQSSFRVINFPTSIPTRALVIINPVIINNVVLPTPQPINPSYSNLTSTNVIIHWTTNNVSDSHIQYYTSPTDAYTTHQPNDTTTDHVIPLHDLQPNTTYSYVVWSTDHARQVVTSRVNSFTTLGQLFGALLPRDNAPPAITSLRAAVITQNTAIISWATNEEASDRVYYSTNATDTTPITNYEFNTPPGNFSPSGARKVSLRNLSPGTTYSFRAVSKDRSENVAVSLRGTFTTLVAENNQAEEALPVDNQDLAPQNNDPVIISETDAVATRNELLGNSTANTTTASSEKIAYETAKEAVMKELQKESPRKNSVGSSEFDSLDRLLDDLIVHTPGVALLILFVVIALIALSIFILFKKFAKSVVARRVLIGSTLLFIMIFILVVSPFITGFIYSLPYYFEKNQNDKTLEKIVN